MNQPALVNAEQLTAVTRRSVDDYLGPADKRFFAAGYRRVGYEFAPVAVETRTESDAELHTTVGLTYPVDWSKKKSAAGDLRPHLSTVDGILLGAQAAEALVLASFRPLPAAHRRMWLRAVRIRAGRAPQEDLATLPITANLTATRPFRSLSMSTVDVQVGSMRVSCDVVHDGGASKRWAGEYPDLDVLLGPAESRYYGAGFARGGHRIDELDVRVADLRATATVALAGTPYADQGLEGAYQPAPTMVDSFVTGLQLAQILLYAADAMQRGDSNTLWMRSTVLEVDTPVRPLPDALPLRTGLANAGLISMSGAMWRTADIVSELGGVRFRCSVAHALPAGH
jgi:hypothetical protein